MWRITETVIGLFFIVRLVTRNKVVETLKKKIFFDKYDTWLLQHSISHSNCGQVACLKSYKKLDQICMLGLHRLHQAF